MDTLRTYSRKLLINASGNTFLFGFGARRFRGLDSGVASVVASFSVSKGQGI